MREVQYTGALAYANVNLTFYILNTPVEFNLKGCLLYQDLKFRIGSSDFWLGGRFLTSSDQLPELSMVIIDTNRRHGLTWHGWKGQPPDTRVAISTTAPIARSRSNSS